MYIPRNWEFCSALAKLRTFAGRGWNSITRLRYATACKAIYFPRVLSFEHKFFNANFFCLFQSAVTPTDIGFPQPHPTLPCTSPARLPTARSYLFQHYLSQKLPPLYPHPSFSPQLNSTSQNYLGFLLIFKLIRYPHHPCFFLSTVSLKQLPYFPTYKTQLFPRKSCHKFDLRLMRQG
jgi:hypothetical protein